MNRFAKASCSFLSNLLVSVLLAALAASAKWVLLFSFGLAVAVALLRGRRGGA